MKYLLQDERRRCSHSATSGLIVSVRGDFLVNYDDDLSIKLWTFSYRRTPQNIKKSCTMYMHLLVGAFLILMFHT